MLIKPITNAIDEILKSSGVLKDPEKGNALKAILDMKSLSIDNLVDELANLVQGSQDESIKFRAIDKALQLHGVGKEETSTIPSVTIIIQGAGQSQSGIPEILIPRSVHDLEAIIN